MKKKNILKQLKEMNKRVIDFDEISNTIKIKTPSKKNPKVLEILNERENEWRIRRDRIIAECKSSKGWSDEDRQYLQQKLKFNKKENDDTRI